MYTLKYIFNQNKNERKRKKEIKISHISRHPKVGQNTLRKFTIVTSLFGVWKCAKTQSLVLISFMKHDR